MSVASQLLIACNCYKLQTGSSLTLQVYSVQLRNVINEGENRSEAEINHPCNPIPNSVSQVSELAPSPPCKIGCIVPGPPRFPQDSLPGPPSHKRHLVKDPLCRKLNSTAKFTGHCRHKVNSCF